MSQSMWRSFVMSCLSPNSPRPSPFRLALPRVCQAGECPADNTNFILFSVFGLAEASQGSQLRWETERSERAGEVAVSGM